MAEIATTHSLKVQIVTPERVTFEGTADKVQAPGAAGEFGVLPRHAPMLALLKSGVVTLEGPGGKQSWKVGKGFAEVGPTHVTILVDSSEAV
jgi:F-type H+-transporting ATPase subunit epsilon